MNRYNQLIDIINHVKPKTIVEFGTWNGLRALQMCQAASKHHSEPVNYIGFDLFEDGTDEQDATELNAKKRVPVDLVTKTLEGQGFNFTLIKGDTRETLKNLPPIPADAFAFIDGGHSIETIANDYEAVKHCKTIVFDDYYLPDQTGAGVDTKKYGCNTLLKDKEYLLLPAADPVREGGLVRMAVIPGAAWPGKFNIVVQTKNCVPEKNIQANILYNTVFLERYIAECQSHDLVAVLVSGGPSRLDYLDEIKEKMTDPRHVLFCVKTSHDWLIQNGLIPWACFLLDPRPHVIDFIETPHPDVRYFTASMVHPVTLDRLVEAKAQIWGYHAHVGAGEQQVLQKVLKEAMLVSGGSTAAVRGMSVLHALGFRNFVLYGFDSCYKEKPEKEQTHGLKKKEPVQVDAHGVKFWTDLELLAQAQDFEKLLAIGKDVRIDVRGEGLIPHIWKTVRKSRADFKEQFKWPSMSSS